MFACMWLFLPLKQRIWLECALTTDHSVYNCRSKTILLCFPRFTSVLVSLK